MGKNDRRDLVYSEQGVRGMTHDCCYYYHCSGHNVWDEESERERERVGAIIYTITHRAKRDYFLHDQLSTTAKFTLAHIHIILAGFHTGFLVKGGKGGG